LSGTGLPETFKIYLTSSDGKNNCADKGVVHSSENIVIPPGSVTTLVSQ